MGEQGLHRAGIAEHDDTNTGADGVGAAFPAKNKRFDTAPQTLGGLYRRFQLDNAWQQHPKLIAAQARQHIHRAQFFLHHRRQLRQQLIPGAVAGGVIDQLELLSLIHI